MIICLNPYQKQAAYKNAIQALDEDIKTNKFDKPTLLKTDILFMCMGLKTDIVSSSYYSTKNIRNLLGGE